MVTKKAATKAVTVKLNVEGNLDVMQGTKRVGVVKVHGPRK